MRTGNIGLPVFVLLAAGGVGFLAGRSTAPAPEAEIETAPSPDRQVPVRPPEPPPVTPTLVDALAAIPVPELARGDGVITGTVKTETGEPVPDVLIRGTYQRQRRAHTAPGEVPKDPNLAEAVRDLVLDHHYRVATRVEARTGADGSFRLTGLADERYMIQAYCTGYRIWPHRDWYASPGGRVDFRAQLRATLSFRVLAPDGSEVPDALVSAKSADRNHTESGTPQRPLEVQPGTWTVTAYSAARDARSEPVEVTAGVDTQVIVLRLVAVAGIRGKVIFPEGEEQRHVTVHAIRPTGEELPTARDLRRGGRKCEVWAGMGGGYVFPDLGRGEWLVALVSDRSVVASARVTVEDVMVVRDLEVPAPDPKRHVLLVVTGPDGRPVENARITTGLQHANGNSSSGTHRVKVGKGRYRVPHHESDGDRELKDPVYYLVVEVPGLGQRDVVYDPKTDRELTVAFEAPATLTVRVPNAPEGWLGDRLSASLFRVETTRRSRTSYGPRVEDPRTLVFGKKAPGTYELSLSLRVGEHSNTLPLSTATVTLASGKNEQTLSLPPLYRTTIVLPEGASGNELRISQTGRHRSGMGFSVEAKDGRLELPDLPAGTYRARMSGGGMQGPMEFTLPGPAEIRFAASVINAMKVWIRDPAGLLAQMGFRDGDLIVGAEGKLFENPLQLSAAFLSGAQKESVKLIVDRDGNRIDLAVSLKKLYAVGDKNTLGGKLDEATRPK